jgi:hypothetical protein
MTELIIQTGKHQGKKIDLGGLDCIIGRHEACKIRIASADVSKQHCRLKHKENGVHAKDLGSRNGTFVNEVRLTEEVLLKPGDMLTVGPMTFLVAEGKPAPAPGKKPAEAKAPEKSQSTGEDSEDDLIAAWLSEGGDIEKSGTDTTVVASSQIPGQASEKSTGETPAPAADSPLKTVRDRAQNIIRTWQKEHEKG